MTLRGKPILSTCIMICLWSRYQHYWQYNFTRLVYAHYFTHDIYPIPIYPSFVFKKKRFQISYFFCKFNESSLNMFNASSVFSGGFVNLCCVRVMVFNATFNNISVITWRLVLLVEETGVPGENHQPVASH